MESEREVYSEHSEDVSNGYRLLWVYQGGKVFELQVPQVGRQLLSDVVMRIKRLRERSSTHGL